MVEVRARQLKAMLTQGEFVAALNPRYMKARVGKKQKG
jgi:hypothetical protein